MESSILYMPQVFFFFLNALCIFSLVHIQQWLPPALASGLGLLAHTLQTSRPWGLQKRPVSQISPKDNMLLKKKEEAQAQPRPVMGRASRESVGELPPGKATRRAVPLLGQASGSQGLSCSCPAACSPEHPPETGGPACSLPIVPAPQCRFPCASCLHRKPCSGMLPPSPDGWPQA